MKKTLSGFTIVELLIVIVVIGILAAITIVAYNGVQNRASDSSVAADISSMRKNLELAKVDLGHYPQAVGEFPSNFKFSKTAYDTTLNNIYYITDGITDTYAFGVRSKSGKGYILTSNGLQENVTVSANATATAIGLTWGSATFQRQGFTPPSSWSPSWNWTS
ncbi:MAG: putative ral secretion pathway protein GspG [Candidatus Saccharibacteria bacterium]|nr:putative ral secretion pathway protein GspG [Candidatus Saccharibacteria bacterium]